MVAYDTGLVSLTALNSSDITSTVKANAISVALGLDNAKAIAIGVSFAENVIGWDNLFSENPLEVKAYITNSTVTADGGVTLDAGSTALIDATVEATAA